MLVESTLHELDQLHAFFDRAATFAGHTRERLVALGEAEEVFYRLYPYHYRALQVVRIASQLGKPLPGQHRAHSACESRLMAHVMDILAEATHGPDLTLDDDQSPGEFAFTLWALAFGTRALMNTTVATQQLGIVDGFAASRQATDTMLDAVGWHPLSRHWSYRGTRRRVRTEVFPDEWREIDACRPAGT